MRHPYSSLMPPIDYETMHAEHVAAIKRLRRAQIIDALAHGIVAALAISPALLICALAWFMT